MTRWFPLQTSGRQPAWVSQSAAADLGTGEQPQDKEERARRRDTSRDLKKKKKKSAERTTG